MPTDGELVDLQIKARSGDSAAMYRLWQSCIPLVLSRTAYMRGWVDSAVLMQEAFLVFHGYVRSPAAASAPAYQLMASTFASTLHRRLLGRGGRVEEVSECDLVNEGTGPSPLEDLASCEGLGDALIAARELLEGLGERDQAVIGRLSQGLSQAETARACGLSADQVYGARDRARVRVEGDFMEEADIVADNDRIWKDVLNEAKGSMTAATFRAHLEGTRLVVLNPEQGAAVVRAGSPGSRDWLDHRLRPVVERAMSTVLGYPVVCEFVVGTGASPATASPSPAGAGAAPPPGAGDRPVTEPESWPVPGSTIAPVSARRGFVVVDNRLIDQYLSVIGDKSFAVYVYYARLAGNKTVAWPGYDAICQAVKISRATLSQCNRVLVAAGLIEIERGDRGRSNRYILVDVEDIDDRRIAAIAVALRGTGDSMPTELVDAGGSLETEPSSMVAEPSSMVAEPYSTTTFNNNIQTGLNGDLLADLLSLKVEPKIAKVLIKSFPASQIREAVEYARSSTGLRNPAGFVVKRLGSARRESG